MSGTITAAAASPRLATQAANPPPVSVPRLGGFLLLAGQLALLAAVMELFRVGQDRGPDMSIPYLCYTAFGLFAVHYWLPMRWKETFWVAASIGAAFVWLDWRVAAGLLAAAAAFFAVIRSPLGYWWKTGLIVTSFAGVTYLTLHPVGTRNLFQAVLGITPPQALWVMFGSIFMCRMIVYMHDLKHMKEKPPLLGYLAYFFLLPNYIFPLMPVVDYNTMRLGYQRRDIHEVAQKGIHWMARGATQLIFYRIAFHLRDAVLAEGVHSAGSLVYYMLLTFLLYTRVSGQFHLTIGMLHLFGYDLPETNRKYMLSSSFTDYWRRVNIYWKDFMVKVVYFPVFFRLRKSGQLRAKIVGTLAVFAVTWALHSYQFFWLRGSVLLHPVDTAFWCIFGVLVTANIWWEHRKELLGKRAPKPVWWKTALSTAGTMSVIITLWTLWEAPSFAAFLDLLAWWS